MWGPGLHCKYYNLQFHTPLSVGTFVRPKLIPLQNYTGILTLILILNFFLLYAFGFFFVSSYQTCIVFVVCRKRIPKNSCFSCNVITVPFWRKILMLKSFLRSIPNTKNFSQKGIFFIFNCMHNFTKVDAKFWCSNSVVFFICLI